MDIYDALVVKLKATAGLTALVGQRIFPDEIPQGTTLPAVFYITVSDIKLYTHDGLSYQESPMIQISTYASTRNSAAVVAEQIKTALVDFVGTLSGITIQRIGLINEIPGMYKSADGTTKINTHDLEFEVIYERS